MSNTIQILNEINQLCVLDGIDVIKVTADNKQTLIQSRDEDKTLFVEATLVPVEDFIGEFGLTDLKMLSACLKFHGLTDVDLRVGTREVAGDRVMDELEFRGKGAKSIFKLMDSNHITKQAKISSIPWVLTLDQITKDKIKDFSSFAQMFSAVSDGYFDISSSEGKLVLSFGRIASSTHSGSIEFADIPDLKGDIGTMSFPVSRFIMLLKIAAGNDKSKLMFSSNGLLGVETETELGVYRYYLRQVVR